METIIIADRREKRSQCACPLQLLMRNRTRIEPRKDARRCEIAAWYLKWDQRTNANMTGATADSATRVGLKLLTIDIQDWSVSTSGVCPDERRAAAHLAAPAAPPDNPLR